MTERLMRARTLIPAVLVAGCIALGGTARPLALMAFAAEPCRRVRALGSGRPEDVPTPVKPRR